MSATETVAENSSVCAALVLYCHEQSTDGVNKTQEADSALITLARFAYDTEKLNFVNRSITPNISLRVESKTDATYIFASDYITNGVRGPEQISGTGVPLIKRTQRSDGSYRFYPPEGLYEPVILNALTDRTPDGRLIVTLRPVAPPAHNQESLAQLSEQAYLHLLETAEL